MRVLPEFGGRSRTTADDYVEGPPELIIEIAYSSRAIDLHGKCEDYTRYEGQEYLAMCLREKQLRWFDLRGIQELQHGAFVSRLAAARSAPTT